jgi:hypothetical protein
MSTVNLLVEKLFRINLLFDKFLKTEITSMPHNFGTFFAISIWQNKIHCLASSSSCCRLFWIVEELLG